jgi:uncharacterized NAD(P)/FAD-binding protein YdhS
LTDLVIIGGGFSGTLAAIEALNQSKQDGNVRDIVLVERTRGQEAGGVAYSKVTAQAYHETNIAAKNMGLSAKETARLAEALHINPKKVMPRRLVQEFLDAALAKARTYQPGDYYEPAHFRIVNAEAQDLIEDDDRVRVRMLQKSKNLDAIRVIVATGNLQQRQLPCLTDKLMKDRFFKRHFVANQWLPAERGKIEKIPADASVLIIGTALSGYDAVRSLLRQGHVGKITMMSRHGLEPFQYPEEHDWKDLTLPEPKFLESLRRGDFTGAKRAATAEFHQLTGLKVDLDKGTITPDTRWQRIFNRRSHYMPEQVLKQWEKNLTEVAGFMGKKAIGQFLKKYSSLIAVLRVGAGHSVCEEIKAAKERGQLEVIAADINAMQPVKAQDGIGVTFTKQGGEGPQTERFQTIISSLGPEHDYSHTKNTLWRNILKREFTAASETGIGVEISTRDYDYGRLPGSDRIYAAGVAAAGENMLKTGLMGPPAFSVPGMREGIRKTTSAAVNAIGFDHRRDAPSYNF